MLLSGKFVAFPSIYEQDCSSTTEPLEEIPVYSPTSTTTQKSSNSSNISSVTNMQQNVYIEICFAGVRGKMV